MTSDCVCRFQFTPLALSIWLELKCFTYLASVFHLCLLSHSIWTCWLVPLILYRSKKNLFHLPVPDVWAGGADQHLQIGRGRPRLHQGRVFDGRDVGQVRGGTFSVYQQSGEAGLRFHWCASSPVFADVFL